MKNQFVIKSNKNGNYLSNLFEDSHDATFQSPVAVRGKVYIWDNREIAESIAAMSNGCVEELKTEAK
jgi:hypothetical protein